LGINLTDCCQPADPVDKTKMCLYTTISGTTLAKSRRCSLLQSEFSKEPAMKRNLMILFLIPLIYQPVANAAPAATPLESEETGHVTIVGEGVASAAPEFVRLSVSVTSLCYATSRAAKDANAILANEILTVLEPFTANLREPVTTTGGANLRQTEIIYLGNTPKTLCERLWRTTNTINLKVKTLDVLPDLQDQILTTIDEKGEVDPEISTQTYAELSQPQFSLSSETIVALRSQAQGNAYDDAKAQFDTFVSRCTLRNPRLTTIEPPTYDMYPRQAGARIGEDNASTPLIPDDIAVSSSWRFIWTFDPSPGC
jgi:uncharacterized protein YggE